MNMALEKSIYSAADVLHYLLSSGAISLDEVAANMKKADENTIVTSLVSKDEAQKAEIDELVEKKFEGSLPAFIAAFAKSKKLSQEDIDEIRRIIDK